MSLSAALNVAKNSGGKDVDLAHMRTALFLVFTFIKEGLKTTKVKSTACSSKEIKTNNQRAFCETHRLLSYP